MVQSTRIAPPCPFEKIFPSQLQRDDAFYMQLAYNLAIDAWKVDEVPIGAVIELGGEVIAAAHNQRDSTRDPTAHAEIIAIGAACQALDNWRLDGCTLYVTLEPCPMCAGAILNSRISRVVFGAKDKRLGALGSTYDILRENPINREVQADGPVMEEECLGMLQDFFREIRSRKKNQPAEITDDVAEGFDLK